MAKGTPATNGYDSEKLNSYINKIESVDAEKESEKGASMQRQSVLTTKRKAIYDEAKDDNINITALKAEVKIRRFDRKKAKVREDLEADDREDLDKIEHSLGMLADTPLGQAAMGSAKDRNAKLDNLHA